MIAFHQEKEMNEANKISVVTFGFGLVECSWQQSVWNMPNK